MASLSRHRKGWQIQWAEGRDRKTLYPGSGLTKKQAGTIRAHVENLVTSRKSRTGIPDATASWVAGVDPAMRQKLHKAGLIEKPAELAESDVVTLGAFVDRYIASRTDAKPASKVVWGRCRRSLVDYFGAERALDSIGLGDAKDFRSWLLTEGRQSDGGLSENTCRKMCSVASQFFGDAVDRELIAKNPFRHRDIPRTTKENRSRDCFVSRQTVEAVIASCPDIEWKLIIALSRFGGLRCPSEHLALRWRDVNWDRDRIIVRSPKTEHHEGRESRVVPIFEELRPYLTAAWEAAPDGSEFVLSRYRDSNANLRTQLLRIIDLAGVEAWPKPFHNMRASRQTELTAEFPLHVACGWLGNSPAIAARHYLTVTDADFAKASGEVLQSVLPNGAETERSKATDETGPVHDSKQNKPQFAS